MWAAAFPFCPPAAPQDHEELYGMGVAAIFGPGTRIPAAALDMIQLLVGGGDGEEDDSSQQQQASAGGQGPTSG